MKYSLPELVGITLRKIALALMHYELLTLELASLYLKQH